VHGQGHVTGMHAREVNHVRQRLHRPRKRFMDNDHNVTPPTRVVYPNRGHFVFPLFYRSDFFFEMKKSASTSKKYIRFAFILFIQ
jgi:hypothetical protein